MVDAALQQIDREGKVCSPTTRVIKREDRVAFSAAFRPGVRWAVIGEMTAEPAVCAGTLHSTKNLWREAFFPVDRQTAGSLLASPMPLQLH